MSAAVLLDKLVCTSNCPSLPPALVVAVCAGQAARCRADAPVAVVADRGAAPLVLVASDEPGAREPNAIQAPPTVRAPTRIPKMKTLT